MLKPVDKRIVAAIKDRDARTDRYGEDLVFLVVHDLKDREYVDQHMPKHKAACRLFEALSENEQYGVVRQVLEEPEPKVSEAADELREALEAPVLRAMVEDYSTPLRKLIEKIETIIPYVTATISPGNTFGIAELRGAADNRDTKDWIAVHAGRASSSLRQLESLLEEARTMRTP